MPLNDSGAAQCEAAAQLDADMPVLVDMRHLRDSEFTLWAIAFVAISFVGVFARFLDAAEAARRDGRNRARNSNIFCATFTGAVALMYGSIICVQGGRGSLGGMLDVLVGRATLTPLEEFQARLVHAMMLGYMVQDLVGRWMFGHLGGKTMFIVHHVACIVGLVNSLAYGQSGMFGAAVGLSEFSTPILAVMEIALADELKQLAVAAGLVMNLLFPVRVLMFSGFFYLWLLEHAESPLLAPQHESLAVNASSMLAIAALTALQWAWWFALVSGTVAALLPAKKTSVAKMAAEALDSCS